ncbi:MAG: hypothetical protein Q7S61_05605 [bacterium]|nr:hypothetical protein [bacterium]
MEQTESNIPVNSSPSLFSFKNLIPLSIFAAVLVILTSVGTYIILKSKTEKTPIPQTLSISPTNSMISPTITPDDMKNWKTYTNKDYGFLFKYPVDPTSPSKITIREVDNKSAGQFDVYVDGWSEKVNLDIQYLEPNYSRYYLGSKVITSEKIGTSNTITWDHLFNPGYCDAGQCGKPFIVYQTIKDNYRFAFVFNETENVTKEKIEMVSTFKFSDTKQATSTENVLDLIRQWTTPMVWSDKKSDTATYRLENNNDISLKGVSIVSIVKDKSENKIGPLTSSEYTNLKSEGWTQDENNSAGGVEGLNFAYKKDISGKRSVLIISQRAGENGQGMKFTAFMSDEFTP